MLIIYSSHHSASKSFKNENRSIFKNIIARRGVLLIHRFNLN